ncbi:MAG: PD-(D/E)XK nuclease family protein [Alphaproteobacteria bacterium]|nr:PD-(D/E)XK nuclease family protein [Alphaproteobacteria bacterium]
MRPNLFDFATSELSQDAVLAWLLAWADASHAAAAPDMHQAGRAFLQCLLGTHGQPLPDDVTATVKARTQVHRIDILATVDLSDGRRLLLPIEDKTDTGPHSGQLERYRKIADELAASDKRTVLPLYVKSGTVRVAHHVRARGWEPIGRGQLLEVLAPQPATKTNAILRDYVDRLESLEAETRSYASLPCADDWPRTGRLWEGLFTELEDRLGPRLGWEGEEHLAARSGWVGWNYVPNAQGGFMGLWWGFRKVDGGELYGQLEGTKLTIKVKADDKSRRQELRNDWHKRIVAAAPDHGLPLTRPTRFGNGKYMTVATAPDWRVAGADDTLDLDATVELLVRVAELVRHVTAPE